MQKKKGYQWPAGYLTVEDMAKLYELRQATKTPINRLIAAAIRIYYEENNPKKIGGEVKKAVKNGGKKKVK